MERIWLLIVITFLSKHLRADYRKTNTSGAWTNVRNECTLATPTITYSAKELTVEINQDIELAEDEKIWVGYIEDLEIFHFYGCIHQNNVVRQSTLDMIATLGMCYSVCSTARYFGVRMNGMNKITCHCIEHFKTIDLTSCGSSDIRGFAFGKMEHLALYERVSIGLSSTLKELASWKNMTNSCLNFLNPRSASLKVEWSPCFTFYSPLCANLERELFQYREIFGSWKKAADQCFDMQKYPVQFQSGDGFNSSNQFWLANIRSLAITKDEGQTTYNYTKYGYIMKVNSKLIMRFVEQGRNLPGLCMKVIVMRYIIDGILQQSAFRSHPICTSLHTELDMILPRRNADCYTTELHQTVDGSSNGLVGVYVGVTLVIAVVVIVIGTVILFKRKRHASPEKINNTRRNLRYEPNTQPNQNINAHRPDSAEVYHETQDVTESTNEGYDTIPDGYLQKSTQNNNTEMDCFVLEKHDNADYEFAKEVVGETEHVYDRKPINTAMAITDDYDNINKGNAVLKQSLEDQPYDTTSHVKQKYQDPTYDHTGDHTTYNHTGNNADYDHTGDHTSYNHTWKQKCYDHNGDHTTYDHTGDNADYDHTGDNADYDHTGDHNSYDHTGDNANYDHTEDDSAYDLTEDQSDKTDFKV